MSESAAHRAAERSARSTRSTTRRSLLVASDRISTFDVVLATTIPDKGRVLTGLSAFWFARTRAIVPNHLLELGDGRSHHDLPPARDAPGRVRRARLSRRAPAGRTTARPVASAATRFRRARGVGASARADRHPGDQGGRGSRREHRRGAGAQRSAGRGATREARRRARALPLRVGARRVARNPPRRHEVRVRRCAGRRRRPRRRGDDAGLVALLARGGVRAGRRRSRRSTSSSCATGASRLAGTRKPRPGAARRCRRGDACALRRRVRAADRDRLRGLRRPTRRSCCEGDRARPSQGRDPRPAGRRRPAFAAEARVRRRDAPASDA